jgi:ABC-type uncharacterized transport system ATPase subunit
MTTTLKLLIELIEYSKVKIEFQTGETEQYSFDGRTRYVTECITVIDASKLLEQLYNMEDKL